MSSTPSPSTSQDHPSSDSDSIRHRLIYAALAVVIAVIGEALVVRPSPPDKDWQFGALWVIAAGFIVGGFAMWGFKRLTSSQTTWRRALMATLLIMLLGMLVCTSCGFWGDIDPKMAMRSGTSLWFVSASAFGAWLAPRFGSATAPGSHRAQTAAVALLGVAVAAVPIVADGTSAASADRLSSMSAIDKCDPAQIATVDSLQYVFTDSSSEPTSEQWRAATVVAIINGQFLDDVRWPPLLAADQWMHRRYQIHSARTGESGAQKITDEFFNGFESMLTLGASASGFSPGEGTVSIANGCPG